VAQGSALVGTGLSNSGMELLQCMDRAAPQKELAQPVEIGRNRHRCLAELIRIPAVSAVGRCRVTYKGIAWRAALLWGVARAHAIGQASC
jgi:hypothetical protein